MQVQWDAQAKRVLAAELLRFRDLALAAKRIDPPPADAAARLLAEEINAGRLPLPNWDHSVEQWLVRLRLLGQHCADLQLPPITDEDKKLLIEQLCHGAVSYKDIQEREVKPVVMSCSRTRNASWTNTHPSGWRCRTAHAKVSMSPAIRRTSRCASGNFTA